MKNKKALFLIIIGIMLIISALYLQLHNNYEDIKAGKESKEVVEVIQEELNTQEIKEDSDKETIKVNGDEYIGIINIPSLNVELPVMSDWSYEKMKKSPARYYGSLETNDLVICAHSYKNFFRYIKNLVKGDIVVITDINGNEYLFEVKVVEILKPENIKEMIESEFDLTLFTCTYDSQNRVTVRLNRVNNISKIEK